MNKAEFLGSLPKREALYIIHSRLTRLPYTVCNEETVEDEVFFFAEEMAAVVRAKQLSEEGVPVYVMKIEQKDLLRFFSELYAYGVTMAVISVSGAELRLTLPEIVRRQGWEKLPENMRPLENPALQLSMIYYLQEARKGAGHYDGEAVAEQEDEMAVNLLRGKYLLPVKEVEMEGQKLTQILLIRSGDGAPMAPIFSDAVEYNRLKKEDGLKAAVTDFEKLAQVPLPKEVGGFLLNPGSVALVLTKEYIRKELELNR